MSDVLRDHLEVWNSKPVLRLVYDDFYRRIAAECVPGLTIELGGGIGNLKQRLENVVSTDVQPASWLDCVADAQNAAVRRRIGEQYRDGRRAPSHRISQPTSFTRPARFDGRWADCHG